MKTFHIFLAYAVLTNVSSVEIEKWAKLPLHAPPETIFFLDDGNVVVGTFADGQPERIAKSHPTGNGELYIFNPDGELLRVLDLPGVKMNVHHSAVHPTTGQVLIMDPGNSRIVATNLEDGSYEVWADELGPFADDYDFDVHGNMYLTEVIEGVIWKIAPDGSKEIWLKGGLLAPGKFIPFGANGIVFNQKQDALFVSHTGDDYIMRIPILDDYKPGEPEVWSVGFNLIDGLAIDENDTIYAAELMGNCVSIINNEGVLVGRIGGDVGGVNSDGEAVGFNVPAEVKIHDGYLYITNCAADFQQLFNIRSNIDAQNRKVDVHHVNRIKISDIELWDLSGRDSELKSEL